MEKITPSIINQKLGKRLVLLFLFVSLFAFSGVNTAEAAALYFSPSSGNYHEGENFTISIKVKTDVAINAIEGVFSFPTQYLQVMRLNKNSSLVNLWIQEPSFSNAGDFGNVTFEGVILNPGFTGSSGEIIDIVFQVKNKGAAELEFLKTAILANDGLGTNVTASDGKAELILLAAETPSKEETTSTGATQQQPLIILKELPQALPAGLKGAVDFWNALPYWIKIGMLVLTGTALLISSFILISFGLIILIYLWRYAVSKREVVLRRLKAGSKLSSHALRRGIKEVLIWLKLARREFESDVKYGLGQVKTDFKEAAGPSSPSFAALVKDFWLSIGKIIKRFFTRNIRPSSANKSAQGKKRPKVRFLQ